MRAPGAVRQRNRERNRERERGLSTVEVVVLAPVMLLFILVLVSFGQHVSGRSAVYGAARDAARAGSLERDTSAAMREARAVADDQLDDVCVGGTVRVVNASKADYGHENGTLFTIEVSCEVRGIDLMGLGLETTMSGRSSSPIDYYRRSG